MNPMKAWEKVALAALLLLELWAFSGAFQKFFNLDSLFYILRYPKNSHEFLQYIAGPDSGKQYRPLTLWTMGLLVPWLGKLPQPYHWIPFLFHFVNTVLFYLVSRKLLRGPLGVLFAVTFWGLHSVAGWIVYDITYISDFMATFFLLAGLWLGIHAREKRCPYSTAGSLLALALALFTKEAATAFPLALWMTLGLAEYRAGGEEPSAGSIRRAFTKPIPIVAASLGFAVGFAGLLIHWVRAGVIYTQGQGAAYHISPFANLATKFKYLFWAVNFPDAIHGPSAGRSRGLVFAAMAILLIVWLTGVARQRKSPDPAIWCGLIWFAGLALPALMLSDRLAKWYLYTPLLGLALAAGALVDAAFPFARRWRVGNLFLACGLALPMGYATMVQARSHYAVSDPAYASDVIEACVSDFRSLFPSLPASTDLVVLPFFEREVGILLSAPPIDHGELFELYGPGARIRTFFPQRDGLPPAGILSAENTRVVQYLNGRLYDVSGQFKSRERMTLHVLPTHEGKAPPLLLKEPLGGSSLYSRLVQLSLADQGSEIPDDYLSRDDLWILQYHEGTFTDITRSYMAPGANTVVLLPTLDGKVPPIRPLHSSEAMSRFRNVRLRALFEGDLKKLPQGYLGRPDVEVLQYFGGTYYDVTRHFRGTGNMTVFVAPTVEGKAPILLRKAASSPCKTCVNPVQILYADEGSRLPEGYEKRSDIWILQYLNGRVNDVTDYWKGRKRDGATRVIRDVETLSCGVSRDEFYPDYEKFGTPNGKPIFFSSPEKEIVTQIGGSTVSVPLGIIPKSSRLVFDVSWMYGAGDGAWAEMLLQVDGNTLSLFREYMTPDSQARSLKWQEVKIDLASYAGKKADLVLKCSNERGRNTVSDWLNWRDIVLESGPAK